MANMANEIKVGDKVRSFDFPLVSLSLTGLKAFYFEGVVEKIEPWDECPCGKDHYHIKVTQQVRQGVRVSRFTATEIFPAVTDQTGTIGDSWVEKIA